MDENDNDDDDGNAILVTMFLFYLFSVRFLCAPVEWNVNKIVNNGRLKTIVDECVSFGVRRSYNKLFINYIVFE